MEFRIAVATAEVNLPLLEEGLHAFDPAAVVDLDPRARQLRVAAAVSAPVLACLLNAAGLTVDLAQVQPQPSVCCGGCGG